MSPQTRPRTQTSAVGSTARWETIRYALDSTPRTARLCAILLAASFLPAVIIILTIRR